MTRQAFKLGLAALVAGGSTLACTHEMTSPEPVVCAGCDVSQPKKVALTVLSWSVDAVPGVAIAEVEGLSSVQEPVDASKPKSYLADKSLNLFVEGVPLPKDLARSSLFFYLVKSKQGVMLKSPETYLGSFSFYSDSSVPTQPQKMLFDIGSHLDHLGFSRDRAQPFYLAVFFESRESVNESMKEFLKEFVDKVKLYIEL